MCTRTSSAKSKGPSTELMPSIMNALDGFLDDKEHRNDSKEDLLAGAPRKIYQANNFANLSFNVQKILSNVSDQEISKRFASEESLPHKKHKCKRFSPEKVLYKSNESLELISPNVQKMLSNLPDAELVISNNNLHADDKKLKRNSSFLHSAKNESANGKNSSHADSNSCGNNADISPGNNKSILCTLNDGTSAASVCDKLKTGDSDSCGDNAAFDESADSSEHVSSTTFASKPLGSYLHTSPSGIASRTPVGRKNMGKYLQIPSESSVGTNSTTSSEVSRPVSLTSLGSCSSSGSSGTHQPGSAYQASAESLDSDPEPSGIKGSADSGIAEEPATISRKEYDVVAEITDTEAKYVEDIHKVIQDYLEPWRADPNCCFQDRLPQLFGNLEEIHEFNSSFLEQLRDAKLDPSLTAKAFINNPGFSIYTNYCTNYPKTLHVLNELMNNPKTAKYFKDVQLEKKYDLTLGSYLLKPVQRILRYRLLLERLSEMCKPEHKRVVDLALTTMTGVADDINNMKRKHEIAIRIQEIQSQLFGWDGSDLTTLGELIAEGSFRVGGAKGRRHLFLFDKLLLLTKCKQDGTFTYKSHIMCSNLMLLEQVKGEPLSFHVLPFDNPRLQCTLRARSPRQKKEWTGQIKRVIIENYSAEIPNHAQQLLMKLGQDDLEKEENTELWTPLKHHSSPCYLERRTRIRKSRDLSTRRAASHDRSFPSLGSWRRKSEPNVQQYDTKTVPSRISKIKTAKGTSTFYTDLSDSETCDMQDESNDKVEMGRDCVADMDANEEPDLAEPESQGKIVSDLVMQNQGFQKAINRRHRNLRESETDPNICIKQEKDPVATKADSLPRSFQLNDQIDSQNNSTECLSMSEVSLKEADVEVEDLPEHNISTQLDNSDHPEHKIYRKSAIRFSLLQRYHAIKERHKKSTAKQGSKIVGARIANPDYEDPQKLFSNSPSLSQSTMSITSSKSGASQDVDFDAPEDLDMTINENEVLTEFDKRLQKNEEETYDNGQKFTISSQHHSASASEISTSAQPEPLSRCSSDILNSSQSSDSYYESLLEQNLNENANIEKCDSFRLSTSSTIKQKYVGRNVTECTEVTSTETEQTVTYCKKAVVNSPLQGRKSILRQTKEPPPIPLKPTRFLHLDNNFRNAKPRVVNRESINESTNLSHSSSTIGPHKNEIFTRNDNKINSSQSNNKYIIQSFRSSNTSFKLNSSTSVTVDSSSSGNKSNERAQSKGWVKTVVGRFE